MASLVELNFQIIIRLNESKCMNHWVGKFIILLSRFDECEVDLDVNNSSNNNNSDNDLWKWYQINLKDWNK